MAAVGRSRLGTVVAAAALIGSALVASPPASQADPLPVRVTNAAADSLSSSQIHLHWRNPGGATFTGTLVRVAPGDDAPSTPTSGHAAGFVDVVGHALTVGKLQPGQHYSFGLFAMYSGGHYSAVTATHATTGPAKVAHVRALLSPAGIDLEWANPNTPSFRSTFVRLAQGDSPPATPSDGTAVALKSPRATAVQLRGLKAGTRYSVSIWTRDSAKRWSTPATAGFTTRQATTTGTLSGVVTDREGHALAGAVVYATDYYRNATYESAPTGTAGRYRLAVPSSHYVVDADGSHAVGGDSDATGYVAASSAVTVVGTATRVHDYELAAGGLVRGRITDTAGHPLAGIAAYVEQVPTYVQTTVSSGIGTIFGFEFDEYQDLTAADGSYAIRGVAPNAYLACAGQTDGLAADGSAAYLARCQTAGVMVRGHADTVAAALALTAERGGAIAGIVVGGTGKPVAGADVAVETASGGFVGDGATSPDGTYEVAGLGAGTFQVCVHTEPFTIDPSPAGSAPGCRSGVTVIDGHTTTAKVTLRPGAALSGTVRSVHGHAVALASVLFHRRNGRFGEEYYAVTDADGHYVAKGLAPGSYRVCVQTYFSEVAHEPTGVLPGCYHGTAYVSVTRGSVRTGIDVDLAVAGAISGRVTDASGAPMRFADVEAQSRTDGFGTATTDKDGRFRMQNLSAGQFQLCAIVPRVDQSEQSACATGLVKVTVGHTTAPVAITLPVGGTVQIAVRDGDGDAVGGVNVALVRACGRSDWCETLPLFGAHTDVAVANSYVTDGSGVADFGYVPAGTYAACAFAYHGATATDTPATGFADGCTGSTFTLSVTVGHTTAATQILQPGGVVTGHITDGSGHPISEARIHVAGSPADDVESEFDLLNHFQAGVDPVEASFTDKNGSFTLRGVRAGTPNVCVDASAARGGTSDGGYADACTPAAITVTAGQQTSVPTLSLAAGGAIDGSVRDSDGTSLRQVFVTVFDAKGHPVGDGFQGRSGHYAVNRLPAGTYVVCFEAFRYRAQCFDGVPWSERGLPTGTTPLTVTPGDAVEGIDAVLVKR